MIDAILSHKAAFASTGYLFDYVPRFFITDLLLHEAHRHPYSERLSRICLMIIQDDSFASNGGVAWRQLLVSALFRSVLSRGDFEIPSPSSQS